MKSYHVKVEIDNGWYVGRVLERPGITTQARTLDGLVEMLRDAIKELWRERSVALELLMPARVAGSGDTKKKRRKAA